VTARGGRAAGRPHGVRRRPLTAFGTGLAALLLLAGCAHPVAPGDPIDPIERLGKKAAEGVRTQEPTRTPDPGAYRRWGLDEPLAPPPERPDRPPVPRAAGPGLLPVLDHVRTKDRVVFLTYDDSAEQDLRFVDMIRELRLPVTVFLTDTVVGPGYGYFARLRSVGVTVQNHTLEHRSLRGLPFAGQRAEICGQQDKLRKRFGIRPTLFRPPYGAHDTNTLRATAACGLSSVVLWRASMRPEGLHFGTSHDHLRAGDIILAHPEGAAPTVPTSLVETTTRLLRRVQEEGFAVARLEDYL
jgi:peptidoglycan/xylan/chitin deacetylase (PgdA/CDA1 family)